MLYARFPALRFARAFVEGLTQSGTEVFPVVRWNSPIKVATLSLSSAALTRSGSSFASASSSSLDALADLLKASMSDS